MKNHNNIGRMLCLVLVLCLSLSAWPAVAFAAETGTADVAINAANFPDDTFREYVKQFDLDQDGTLSENELASVNRIDVQDSGINSLQGIEYFTVLEYLDCDNNQLTALDVSKNTALDHLDCNQNQLTALDVSKNTALDYLECSWNQLTALDVSKNTALVDLGCSGNQLTTLDLSKNTALDCLDCSKNLLTALDVSKNTALGILECSWNQLTALDVSKNTALVDLGCSGNQLTTLDLSKNTALEYLYCNENQLTALDVRNNPELIFLDCSNNYLSSLDLSNNPKATQSVYARGNAYVLPQGTNFDYTTLPGTFDIDKVSDVVGGSFNKEKHTFSLDHGKTTATYTYDMGNGLKETFILHINPFTDVKQGNYYYDSVLWAIDNEITDGTAPNTFSPEKNCKRSQIVTFLWRAAGSPEPVSSSSPFKDVQNPSAFYYKAVLWAAENSITSGITADAFKPDATCTRAQAVTFLWRACDRPHSDTADSFFTDVQDPEKYYYTAVLWAAENNITTGVAPNVFRPDGICKRGQIVTFLYRYLED